MSKKSFSVPSNVSLVLEDLWAKVAVQRGEVGQVTVEMTGEQKLLDKIKVEQQSSGTTSLKGELNGTTIISTFNGGISITGSVRGVVVVNGKVISGGNDDIVNSPASSAQESSPAHSVRSFSILISNNKSRKYRFPV